MHYENSIKVAIEQMFLSKINIPGFSLLERYYFFALRCKQRLPKTITFK